MAARKLAAIAELIRRSRAGCPPEGPRGCPRPGEFTGDELAYALAESRGRGEDLLTIAAALDTQLPGTRAALRDGTITWARPRSSSNATGLLDAGEARAAEAKVLDRAGPADPGRAARRDRPRGDGGRPGEGEGSGARTAARDARVERWAEDSGNAALMGRELPPAEVLAADQRITAWAGELKKAGLDGGMDELRARAYLDLLLGKDSRPPAPAAADGAGPDSTERPGPGRARAPAGPPAAGRGRRGAGRVRRAGHPDRPAGHPARPGGPARRAPAASAPSTPGWPATSPRRRRATPRRPGA